MAYPKQSMPVKRPDLVEPATCVDLVHDRGGNIVSGGNIPPEIIETLACLVYGANYNDPAAFAYRSYSRVMHSGWSGFASMGRRF